MPEVGIAAFSGNPHDVASHGELAESLRTALAELEPNLAAAFSLICLEGLSNREAAEAVGVKANHVGVLLHRAKAALREKLRAFAPDYLGGFHRG